MNVSHLPLFARLCLLLFAARACGQDPASVAGVKGVKQEAIESVKNVKPDQVTGAAHAAPPPAAVQPVTGVKQDAVESVKKVETGTVTGAMQQPPPPPPPLHAVQPVTGVKEAAVNTVGGVREAGQAAPVSVQPVTGMTAPAGGSIEPIHGVTGIAMPKLQNLEAALRINTGEPAAPAKGGKSAAAALGTGTGGKSDKPALQSDGRSGFQEFEKLQSPGS